MSPENLDKARAEEAWRRSRHPIDGAINPRDAFNVYRELVVSNWTPPDPISPRVLAAREWLKRQPHSSKEWCAGVDQGVFDNCPQAKTFLAGVAWAVKLAEPLVNAPVAIMREVRATYHQAIGGDHEGQ